MKSGEHIMRWTGKRFMSKDLVDLAISMTEMDTGIQLSTQERETMSLSILAKIEGTNQ
jgi:hypothetical protein